jgi:hypothetical protein
MTPEPTPVPWTEIDRISIAKLKQEMLCRSIAADLFLLKREEMQGLGCPATRVAISRLLDQRLDGLIRDGVDATGDPIETRIASRGDLDSPFDDAVRSVLGAAGAAERPYGPLGEELLRRIDERFMAMTMADIRRFLQRVDLVAGDSAAATAPGVAAPPAGEPPPDGWIAGSSTGEHTGQVAHSPPPPPLQPQAEHGTRDWSTVPEMSRSCEPGAVFNRFAEPPLDPAHDHGRPIDFDPDHAFMQLVEEFRQTTVEELHRLLQPVQKPPWAMRWLASFKRSADAIESSTPAGALDLHEAGNTIARAAIAPDAPLLVIGDIHGDSWSLAAALALADHPDWLYEQGLLAPPKRELTVLLLGDLVDRGPDSPLCALMALRRFRDRPLKSLMVAGNHDVSYSWVESGNHFSSLVEPCEFGDWLNRDDAEDAEGRIRLGRKFVEFVAQLPRAIVTPSGLLAVHAGVPHIDLLPKLTDLESLQASGQARDDFTWLRLAERASKKIPNRSSRGCEIGTHQWAASIDNLSSILGRAGWPRIRCAVRGHDHHTERFHVHQAGFPPLTMLTVNSMGDAVDDPIRLGSKSRHGCVAVYDGGRMPRLVRIVMPLDPDRLMPTHDRQTPEPCSGAPDTAQVAEPVVSSADRQGGPPPP